MFKKIAVAAVLATLAASSFAGTPGFYIGGEVGSTKLDNVSDNKASYGVVGGFNFNQNFAVELGYGRLGSWNNVYGEKVDVDQAAVSVIGAVPLNSAFSIYGRLGYNHIDMSNSFNTSGALYGVGVSYNFNARIVGRAEVQRPASDASNVRVGVTYSF